MIRAGEVCPRCGAEYSNVYDSRVKYGCRHRRKECIYCGERWTTIEVCEKWKNLGVAHEFDRLPIEYQRTVNQIIKDFYEMHLQVQRIKKVIKANELIPGERVEELCQDPDIIDSLQ